MGIVFLGGSRCLGGRVDAKDDADDGPGAHDPELGAAGHQVAGLVAEAQADGVVGEVLVPGEDVGHLGDDQGDEDGVVILGGEEILDAGDAVVELDHGGRGRQAGLVWAAEGCRLGGGLRERASGEISTQPTARSGEIAWGGRGRASGPSRQG